MIVTDLLQKELMVFDLKATDKAGAIDEMAQVLQAQGVITDLETFKQGIHDRENQSTTGLGDGIAIPHAKNSAVKRPAILFAKSVKGIDYDAMDNKPVHAFFMIAAPEGANSTHLEALSSLAKFLMHEAFMTKLWAAKTPEAVLELFEEEKEGGEKQITSLKKIVAVTGCTTGIAHTFMAEEALKKQAKAMGIEIKVETNGASGVGNRLSAQDIATADGVIIASDKKVEMARFNGKPLLERPVAEGIRKPQELLELVLSPNAPIYRSNQHIAELETAETASIGKKFYKHLMGGVSTMLPVVVGGGILIAIAFLVDQLIGVPQDSLGSLGSYNTLAAYFMTIGGAAFGFMLPILAGFIAYSIADKPGLAAGLVAGYLASSGDSFAGGEPVSSGFLGAIVGGFVAGGIILSLKKVFAGLPKSLEGIKTILLYPVLGILLTGLAMFVLNIPMSGVDVGLTNFLNSLSGTSAVLMGALVGGMMAIDMGGPINKAAYVFGTGTLAATVAYGGSEVMAAVMAGGMTPPLAIFLASLIFKKKFNAEEKNGALTNIVMGASFITEGAIPFAAADPARAIPSFMIGSAVAGALVSAAGIRLMAPHGGIFVLALTNNPLLYLAFILLGSLVSALLFGWSKKSKGHL